MDAPTTDAHTYLHRLYESTASRGKYGMTENGQRYISAHKKEFTLPLVSRVAAFDDPMLSQDCKATDLYCLAQQRAPGEDFRRPPILI